MQKIVGNWSKCRFYTNPLESKTASKTKLLQNVSTF